MNLRVVYPSRVPYLLVRHKTKKFLSSTPYRSRHGVFTHKAAQNTYFIRRRTVDILLDQADSQSIDDICQYLKYVFGNTLLGLALSNQKYYPLFSSINYIKI